VQPKIFDKHYKIGPSSDYRAKFHAGRPTHRGDLALKKCCLCFFVAKKCAFGGFNSTSRSPRLLDQTSPDLFRLTREESMSNK